jgi:hypothetical protein
MTCLALGLHASEGNTSESSKTARIPAAGLLRTASTNNRHSNLKKSLGNDRPELLSVRVPMVGERRKEGKWEGKSRLQLRKRKHTPRA